MYVSLIYNVILKYPDSKRIKFIELSQVLFMKVSALFSTKSRYNPLYLLLVYSDILDIKSARLKGLNVHP